MKYFLLIIWLHSGHSRVTVTIRTSTAEACELNAKAIKAAHPNEAGYKHESPHVGHKCIEVSE